MRTTVLTLVSVLILAGPALVSAHHSYADFDQDRSVSVEGTIASILFANPHVVMMVKKDDSTVYTMTWASATQLTRQGVGRDELKTGDRVIVSGSPSRKGPELSKIRDVRRMSDGWRWRNQDGHVSVVSSH
jgi:hypothetical protein